MSFTTLPSGRRVLDTGKVQIGLLARPYTRDHGKSADAIQKALLNGRSAPIQPVGKPALWKFTDAFWRCVWLVAGPR